MDSGGSSERRPSGELVLTPRGRGLVEVLAAFALALFLLGAAELLEGPDGPDDAWLGLSGDAALLAAPCPEPASVALATASPGRTAAAREGRFRVFGSDYTTLRVPIDWSTDPIHAHRYRQNLHKLRFLDPLLASYATTGNLDDLRAALAIAVDWVRQNPRDEEGVPVEAWADKVVGDRVPFLSYLLRASSCEEIATPRERAVLLDSIETHARALASERDYVADNHGLFVDLGLVRLTNFFPFLESAEKWRALARQRFEATLRARLSDGVWLEHSSAYQFLAIRSVDGFLASFGPDPELEELLARMREAAGWFVKPDGEMTQFGDSNQESVPDWAATEAAGLSGLNASFGSGFAFVRAPEEDGGVGYLAVTDGFHNLTHKHADELSFELFDHGASIVSDTGLYHKDPGEIRDFVVSNRAHSVLSVDGLDLPISDPSAVYGSGLVAAGEGDGWYAIEGRNPLLRGQGVRHRRLFLYLPGRALLIIDRVQSSALHTYTRYLQLGPEIEIAPRADGPVGLSAPGFAGAVYDLPAAAPTTRSQARGQREPMQGLTSPDFREFVPRWTVAYSDQAATETRVLSISLDATGLRARGVRATPSSTTIELTDATDEESTLTIERDRRRIAVDSG